jgi:hypothetical protein
MNLKRHRNFQIFACLLDTNRSKSLGLDRMGPSYIAMMY